MGITSILYLDYIVLSTNQKISMNCLALIVFPICFNDYLSSSKLAIFVYSSPRLRDSSLMINGC